jgi:hypothetical protein
MYRPVGDTPRNHIVLCGVIMTPRSDGPVKSFPTEYVVHGIPV